MPLPEKLVEKLDTFTMKYLKISAGFHQSTSRTAFYLYRGLRELKPLNTAIPTEMILKEYEKLNITDAMTDYIKQVNKGLKCLDLQISYVNENSEISQENFPKFPQVVEMLKAHNFTQVKDIIKLCEDTDIEEKIKNSTINEWNERRFAQRAVQWRNFCRQYRRLINRPEYIPDVPLPPHHFCINNNEIYRWIPK
jgi:hypothetical protein